ncbi:hypothetical protein ACVGV8_10780, partial [Enterobacter intestinihominis]
EVIHICRGRCRPFFGGPLGTAPQTFQKNHSLFYSPENPPFLPFNDPFNPKTIKKPVLLNKKNNQPNKKT